MNVSEAFIKRPVTTTLLMIAILVFGIIGYRSLPVSELPNVDFPTILVTASLPGASPETMASAVATPLERQFSTIAGLESMTSVNSLGITQITLQFNLEKDIDAAAQDVQSMITKAAPLLPPGMPNPPTYQKVNPADQPILFYALASPTLPLYMLHEYADTMIAQRISMVNGVAQVLIYGPQKYAVRIRLDPRTLVAKGIGIDEVERAVRTGNVNLPTGTIYGTHRAYTLEATGQLMSAMAFEPLIVAERNGSQVRLKDVATIIDGVENDKVAAWYGTPDSLQRAIVLAIQRQPGTNTVEVATAVKNLVSQLEKQLPASVSMHLLYDRSVSIRASVDDVKFTLQLTVFLVILVIFLFLRNLSATLIPALALPFSLVGTFAIMYLCGYSLDNLSLMALTLSVGFLVDDAIVMLENIVRHMEKGERPMQAALTGSAEIGFTILSMTISLVAVFIPFLFMGGIIGRLFREFAVTISVAILISGIVSLTLTPMLGSRFVRPPLEVKHNRIYTASEKVFEAMLDLYAKTLSWTLKYKFYVLIGTIIILILNVILFIKVPKGFIPNEDKGMVFAVTEASQDISFDDMIRHQQELVSIVKREPLVKAFMSAVGPGPGSPGQNSGRMFMVLKDRSERNLSVDEFINQLRPKFATVPGINTFLQNLPTIRIGGQLTKSLYQFTLSGTNTDELYHYAQIMEDRMRALPMLQDVTSDLQIKSLKLNVNIDRDKAESLGVTAEQIENALWDTFGSRWISTIYAPNNQYQVILELKPEYQRDPSQLSMIYVRSSKGKLVPISTVAEISPKLGPMTINHLGQLPSVTISFNLKPGAALGDAVSAIEKLAKEILPDTITTGFQGAAQAFQASYRGLVVLLFMAIFVIYMVLGILYESFIHPITILSALPFAGVGALVTLMLFNVELNIYSFVGIIMLVGLVKKNGIMMIDFALDAQRNEGKPPVDAIYQASLIRFRPIMMTTMAAILGALPIAIGMGAGSEVRRPLGIAVVGGLLFSQFFTMYVTPVIYIYMDKIQHEIARFLRKKKVPAATPEITKSDVL